MSKFPTSTEFYYRIKHDPNINPTGIKITYLDSLKKKYVDMDFSKWVFVEDGGDIPIHRIYYFKYKDEIIWDREKKILNLEPISNGIELKLPDCFTIITWNILNPKNSSKKMPDIKKEEERQDKIIQEITKLLESTDILCLQEVNKKMLEGIKKNIDTKFNIISTDLKSNDNVVFVTKYLVGSISNVVFSQEKESLKISIDTVSGFEINIYGVHLTSDSASNSTHKRLEQLEKLSKFIDLNVTNIICGDFNEDNSTHRLLTENMFDTFDLVEDIDNAKVDNKLINQMSVYTFDPNTNLIAWENSTTKQAHRYDKIFISKMLKSIKPVEIISEIKCSDHYPVKSYLEFEPNNLVFTPQTKNTSSGLFVIVPPNSTDYTQMQKIRKELDENYSKWMPHLSIHLGWIPESEFADWMDSNEETFKKINPFEVILDKPDFLTHDSAYTLILRPNKSCSNKLVNLFKLFGSESEPHLTIGKFKDKTKLDSKLKLLSDTKLSIKWNLTQLHLVSRKNRDYGVQLGLVRFGNVFQSNILAPNSVQDILSDITNQIKCIYPEIQVVLGGSQLYNQINNQNNQDNQELINFDPQSDLDILVFGPYDSNNFYSSINKFFQSNGMFIHSKFVTNKFMSFIRAIHNDFGELDIHYLETNLTNINKLTDPEQKSKSSVYWDNIQIVKHVQSIGMENIFKQGLLELKSKFKQFRIYGQEFCYIGGISLTIMLGWYLKKIKPEKWDLRDFCEFYSTYNFPTQSISLDSSFYVNKEFHTFATIIGPVSQYNTSRNLTPSTFNLIKYYIDTKFEESIKYNYKIELVIGASNYYLYDDIKSFIRSVYLKIILGIEKNISNSNFKLYPFSSTGNLQKNTKNNYNFKYEFGFNFNPNSISNVFDELVNKILILYPESNAYYTIETN